MSLAEFNLSQEKQPIKKVNPKWTMWVETHTLSQALHINPQINSGGHLSNYLIDPTS